MTPDGTVPAPEAALSTRLLVGERRALAITDVAFGGEGVGRVEGFVVFVPLVAPGEEVEVEVAEVKKSFARARLLRVLRPSADRVTPRCRYFGACGGCQYQHLNYEAQVRLKGKQVADLFERLGHLPAALIRPMIPCPRPYGYRNRIMLRSQWDKFTQSLRLGFLRADSRLVVDVEECPIAEPAISDGIREARAHPPARGGLKVVLRAAPPGWEAPPDSFFQGNLHLLPKLVEVVQGCVRAAGTKHLVDAYCGVGLFALECADLVDSYAGVELDQRAIQAARHNALARRRTNGEFLAGQAEDALPGLLRRFRAERTTVVLDPPRAGCAASLVEVLREVRPAQIVYVSCHPATLARDLNGLAAGGVYEIVQVVPLDMFPQTQHVECVAELRAGGGA